MRFTIYKKTKSGVLTVGVRGSSGKGVSFKSANTRVRMHVQIILFGFIPRLPVCSGGKIRLNVTGKIQFRITLRRERPRYIMTDRGPGLGEGDENGHGRRVGIKVALPVCGQLFMCLFRLFAPRGFADVAAAPGGGKKIIKTQPDTRRFPVMAVISIFITSRPYGRKLCGGGPPPRAFASKTFLVGQRVGLLSDLDIVRKLPQANAALTTTR